MQCVASVYEKRLLYAISLTHGCHPISIFETRNDETTQDCVPSYRSKKKKTTKDYVVLHYLVKYLYKQIRKHN